MYTTISSIYNYPHENQVGTNTFKVRYFDRNLENDNYIDMSVNDMNYLRNFTYMSDPRKDKQILQNMREANSTYNHIQQNKHTDNNLTKIQSSDKGLPKYCNSNTCNSASNNTSSQDSRSIEKYMSIEKKTGKFNLESPEIFGSPLWFTIHNAAIHYPTANPSPETKLRMKNFLLSLPVLVPCIQCKEHCTMFIDGNKDKLDDVTSGRDKLFEFTVDFHNMVNKRTSKPCVSLEDAYKMYTGQADIIIPKVTMS